MTETPRAFQMQPKEVAKNLARLMERELGYQEGHIDPIALGLFIKAYWSRVHLWAHVIHNAETEST